MKSSRSSVYGKKTIKSSQTAKSETLTVFGLVVLAATRTLPEKDYRTCAPLTTSSVCLASPLSTNSSEVNGTRVKCRTAWTTEWKLLPYWGPKNVAHSRLFPAPLAARKSRTVTPGARDTFSHGKREDRASTKRAFQTFFCGVAWCARNTR